MIKKIIVEMEDTEQTFHEFNSMAEFTASEIFQAPVAPPTEAPTPETLPNPE